MRFVRYINCNLKRYCSVFNDSFWKWVDEVGPDGESSHSMNQWIWWSFKIKIDSCLSSPERNIPKVLIEHCDVGPESCFKIREFYFGIILFPRAFPTTCSSFKTFPWLQNNYRGLQGLTPVISSPPSIDLESTDGCHNISSVRPRPSSRVLPGAKFFSTSGGWS